jgi:hypothetical protein
MDHVIEAVRTELKGHVHNFNVYARREQRLVKEDSNLTPKEWDQKRDYCIDMMNSELDGMNRIVSMAIAKNWGLGTEKLHKKLNNMLKYYKKKLV